MTSNSSLTPRKGADKAVVTRGSSVRHWWRSLPTFCRTVAELPLFDHDGEVSFASRAEGMGVIEASSGQNTHKSKQQTEKMTEEDPVDSQKSGKEEIRPIKKCETSRGVERKKVTGRGRVKRKNKTDGRLKSTGQRVDSRCRSILAKGVMSLADRGTDAAVFSSVPKTKEVTLPGGAVVYQKDKNAESHIRRREGWNEKGRLSKGDRPSRTPFGHTLELQSTIEDVIDVASDGEAFSDDAAALLDQISSFSSTSTPSSPYEEKENEEIGEWEVYKQESGSADIVDGEAPSHFSTQDEGGRQINVEVRTPPSRRADAKNQRSMTATSVCTWPRWRCNQDGPANDLRVPRSESMIEIGERYGRPSTSSPVVSEYKFTHNMESRSLQEEKALGEGSPLMVSGGLPEESAHLAMVRPFDPKGPASSPLKEKMSFSSFERGSDGMSRLRQSRASRWIRKDDTESRELHGSTRSWSLRNHRHSYTQWSPPEYFDWHRLSISSSPTLQHVNKTAFKSIMPMAERDPDAASLRPSEFQLSSISTPIRSGIETPQAEESKSRPLLVYSERSISPRLLAEALALSLRRASKPLLRLLSTNQDQLFDCEKEAAVQMMGLQNGNDVKETHSVGSSVRQEMEKEARARRRTLRVRSGEAGEVILATCPLHDQILFTSCPQHELDDLHSSNWKNLISHSKDEGSPKLKPLALNGRTEKKFDDLAKTVTNEIVDAVDDSQDESKIIESSMGEHTSMPVMIIPPGNLNRKYGREVIADRLNPQIQVEDSLQTTDRAQAELIESREGGTSGVGGSNSTTLCVEFNALTSTSIPQQQLNPSSHLSVVRASGVVNTMGAANIPISDKDSLSAIDRLPVGVSWVPAGSIWSPLERKKMSSMQPPNQPIPPPLLHGSSSRSSVGGDDRLASTEKYHRRICLMDGGNDCEGYDASGDRVKHKSQSLASQDGKNGNARPIGVPRIRHHSTQMYSTSPSSHSLGGSPQCRNRTSSVPSSCSDRAVSALSDSVAFSSSSTAMSESHSDAPSTSTTHYSRLRDFSPIAQCSESVWSEPPKSSSAKICRPAVHPHQDDRNRSNERLTADTRTMEFSGFNSSLRQKNTEGEGEEDRNFFTSVVLPTTKFSSPSRSNLRIETGDSQLNRSSRESWGQGRSTSLVYPSLRTHNISFARAGVRKVSMEDGNLSECVKRGSEDVSRYEGCCGGEGEDIDEVDIHSDSCVGSVASTSLRVSSQFLLPNSPWATHSDLGGCSSSLFDDGIDSADEVFRLRRKAKVASEFRQCRKLIRRGLQQGMIYGSVPLAAAADHRAESIIGGSSTTKANADGSKGEDRSKMSDFRYDDGDSEIKDNCWAIGEALDNQGIAPSIVEQGGDLEKAKESAVEAHHVMRMELATSDNINEDRKVDQENVSPQKIDSPDLVATADCVDDNSRARRSNESRSHDGSGAAGDHEFIDRNGPSHPTDPGHLWILQPRGRRSTTSSCDSQNSLGEDNLGNSYREDDKGCEGLEIDCCGKNLVEEHQDVSEESLENFLFGYEHLELLTKDNTDDIQSSKSRIDLNNRNEILCSVGRKSEFHADLEGSDNMRSGITNSSSSSYSCSSICEVVDAGVEELSHLQSSRFSPCATGRLSNSKWIKEIDGHNSRISFLSDESNQFTPRLRTADWTHKQSLFQESTYIAISQTSSSSSACTTNPGEDGVEECNPLSEGCGDEGQTSMKNAIGSSDALAMTLSVAPNSDDSEKNSKTSVSENEEALGRSRDANVSVATVVRATYEQGGHLIDPLESHVGTICSDAVSGSEEATAFVGVPDYTDIDGKVDEDEGMGLRRSCAGKGHDANGTGLDGLVDCHAAPPTLLEDIDTAQELPSTPRLGDHGHTVDGVFEGSTFTTTGHPDVASGSLVSVVESKQRLLSSPLSSATASASADGSGIQGSSSHDLSLSTPRRDMMLFNQEPEASVQRGIQTDPIPRDREMVLYARSPGRLKISDFMKRRVVNVQTKLQEIRLPQSSSDAGKNGELSHNRKSAARQRYPRRNRIPPVNYWLGESQRYKRNVKTGIIEVAGVVKCINADQVASWMNEEPKKKNKERRKKHEKTILQMTTGIGDISYENQIVTFASITSSSGIMDQHKRNSDSLYQDEKVDNRKRRRVRRVESTESESRASSKSVESGEECTALASLGENVAEHSTLASHQQIYSSSRQVVDSERSEGFSVSQNEELSRSSNLSVSPPSAAKPLFGFDDQEDARHELDAQDVNRAIVALGDDTAIDFFDDGGDWIRCGISKRSQPSDSAEASGLHSGTVLSSNTERQDKSIEWSSRPISNDDDAGLCSNHCGVDGTRDDLVAHKERSKRGNQECGTRFDIDDGLLDGSDIRPPEISLAAQLQRNYEDSERNESVGEMANGSRLGRAKDYRSEEEMPPPVSETITVRRSARLSRDSSLPLTVSMEMASKLSQTFSSLSSSPGPEAEMSNTSSKRCPTHSSSLTEQARRARVCRTHTTSSHGSPIHYKCGMGRRNFRLSMQQAKSNGGNKRIGKWEAPGGRKPHYCLKAQKRSKYLKRTVRERCFFGHNHSESRDLDGCGVFLLGSSERDRSVKIEIPSGTSGFSDFTDGSSVKGIVVKGGPVVLSVNGNEKRILEHRIFFIPAETHWSMKNAAQTSQSATVHFLYSSGDIEF